MKREQACEVLIQFNRWFHEGENKDFVIKKIRTLITTFRKYLKKLETSKLSGAGSDDIYEPKVWYFNNIMFLRDQEIPRAGQPGLKITKKNTKRIQIERHIRRSGL